MASLPSTPDEHSSASKSRFFGRPHKKRPWEESDEESVERIELLSARPTSNDNDAITINGEASSVMESAKDYGTEANEENNSKTELTEEQSVPENIASVNPFAKFAFADGKAPKDSPAATKKWTTVHESSPRKKPCVAKKKSKEKKEWIKVADCTREEQDRIMRKWHSLADADAPLETRRFQVMVASRLHARCQEPVVRKCMDALRSQYKPLDAATLSQANPEALAKTISSLQYYNVKAEHLVNAAKQVQTRFYGKVPEKESELKTITGIGPVMADLLAFVNTVDAHKVSEDKATEAKLP